jgi:SAM-dependent methyltransferase
MISIFDKIKESDLDEYFARAEKYISFDKAHHKDLTLKAIKYYKGNAAYREAISPGQQLEAKWYESLKRGAPDYSVYSDRHFIGEIWSCWLIYSRKYLLALKKESALLNNIRYRVNSVADVGCGFGYTTAGLKELFNHAVVYGTNLENTFQFGVASELGAERGFTLSSSVKPNTDLIFASEYFEHFERPIEHLLEIINTAKPRVFIIANSFGSRAIGHFDTYRHGEKMISNKIIGRLFNKMLVAHGYQNVKTKMWNNRPSIWVKQ